MVLVVGSGPGLAPKVLGGQLCLRGAGRSTEGGAASCAGKSSFRQKEPRCCVGEGEGVTGIQGEREEEEGYSSDTWFRWESPVRASGTGDHLAAPGTCPDHTRVIGRSRCSVHAIVAGVCVTSASLPDFSTSRWWPGQTATYQRGRPGRGRSERSGDSLITGTCSPRGRENGDSKWHLSKSHSVPDTVLLVTVSCRYMTNDSDPEAKEWVGRRRVTVTGVVMGASSWSATRTHSCCCGRAALMPWPAFLLETSRKLSHHCPGES